jgi:hypothetical protein
MRHAAFAMALLALASPRAEALDLEELEPPPDPPEPLPARAARRVRAKHGHLCPECGSRAWTRYCVGPGHYRRRVRR